MKLTRRDFIKANAAAAAATVAGITLPISQEAQAQARVNCTMPPLLAA